MFPPRDSRIEFRSKAVLTNLADVQFPSMMFVLHERNPFRLTDGNVKTEVVLPDLFLIRGWLSDTTDQECTFAHHSLAYPLMLFFSDGKFWKNHTVDVPYCVGRFLE